jgi:hypothetical protein
VEEGRRLGKQSYGRALSLVGKAAQSDTTACSDQVVVAVSLLGIYEVSFCFRAKKYVQNPGLLVFGIAPFNSPQRVKGS